MKKLIKNIFLLVITVSLAVIAINNLWSKVMHYSNRIYRNMPDQIAIANTGSSHGAFAFDYSDYKNIRTFNFAMTSQSLQYDYRLIKYYIDHFEKGSILLIPVSYFSFWNNELSEESFDSRNIRYFSVLDRENMRFNENASDYFVQKYLPSLVFIDNKIGSLFSDGNREIKKDIEEIGKERACYHLIPMLSDSGKVLPVLKENQEALIMMIELCEEQNIIPVLLTTPFLKYYSDSFPEEVLEIFYEKLDYICKRYGVLYLDYSKDSSFCENPDFFSDTDHLNEKGAKKFTKIVMDKINMEDVLFKYKPD